MTMRHWRRLIAIALTSALFLGLAPAASAQELPAAPRRIPVAPGVELSAGVYKGSGAGPHPLIVMPPGYSTFDLLYRGAAINLAKAGYDVVTYTPRGQWTSSGQNNLISAEDIKDVSRIIDWAGAELGSDTSRVGITGISQGSILSLMGAAADKRIRAVAAMSAATDLGQVTLPNNTWLSQFIDAVRLGSPVFSRVGPELQQLIDRYEANDRSVVPEFAPTRSVDSVLGRLDANAPALLLANSWQDSILVPGPVVSTFDKYTGPKHLLMSAGDHGSAEAPGAVGLPNEVFGTARRWFDHYLRGAANGIDGEQPVQLHPSLGGPLQGYPSWQAAQQAADRRYLTASDKRTGDLGAAAARWTDAITGGWTVADNGPTGVSGAGAPAGLAVPVSVPLIDRRHGLVWQTEKQDVPRLVSGSPRLHVTFAPGAEDATIFAYLYDVDGLGNGRLLTGAPYTVLGTGGAARTAEFALQPLRHTVSPGHRLVLVVDTQDQRFRSETVAGQELTFSSSTVDPSYLDIPWSR
ncbi:alpha/beta fold hydrolase [Pseudonocardiaceae bacterium YIM PH 21723]|nr:alpha/beta fold hydrolase [Pseudonocardiaceae bacterium YIM PH 21723]